MDAHPRAVDGVVGEDPHWQSPCALAPAVSPLGELAPDPVAGSSSHPILPDDVHDSIQLDGRRHQVGLIHPVRSLGVDQHIFHQEGRGEHPHHVNVVPSHIVEHILRHVDAETFSS